MGGKEPVMVRYVSLLPLAEKLMIELECEHRLNVPGISAGNFYCRRFKLMITISACAICKELEAEKHE